jgi:outer membrane protein TolC
MILLVFMMPFEGKAEEGIKGGEALSLEKCIAIAMKMHPDITAAKNTVNAAMSRVNQAKANYYPQVNWSASYSRISPASGGSSLSSPSLRSADSYDQYSTGFNLSQNIYDFGKTPAQVNIQHLNLDSSRADLSSTTEQIIFSVKQAYYGVLRAKRNREVAGESVRQFQQHLEQAKGFYSAGISPKFDVTKAEVDLSNAKLNLIKAENSFRLAVVTLNNAMGITKVPEFAVEDNLSFVKYPIPFETALSAANSNRPELKSLMAKKQAAETSVLLAKKGYYPALTGNAAYNWSGESFPLERGWNIGAALSFPLFSGFNTKYQVEEARSNRSVLEASEESLKQVIFLQVQQAYLSLMDAEERIPAAELQVKQASENLDIANGRYTAGVGSPVEVTDAEVSLSNAKSAYIQALYDYKIAIASIEKAMGSK